jgi:hypothetical protein
MRDTAGMWRCISPGFDVMPTGPSRRITAGGSSCRVNPPVKALSLASVR